MVLGDLLLWDRAGRRAASAGGRGGCVPAGTASERARPRLERAPAVLAGGLPVAFDPREQIVDQAGQSGLAAAQP